MNGFSKIVRLVRNAFSRPVRPAREVEKLRRMIRMVAATADTEIACEEASRVLDQYADMVIRGEDTKKMMPQVRHHLEMCMDCTEELEALLAAVRLTEDARNEKGQ